MTKADKIRQMSNEELTEWLFESKNCCYCVHDGMSCDDGMCREGIKRWLEAETSGQV